MLFFKFKLYSRDVFSFFNFVVPDVKNFEEVAYNSNYRILGWIMSENFNLSEKYTSILVYSWCNKLKEFIVKECFKQKIYNCNIYYHAGRLGLISETRNEYHLYGSIMSKNPHIIDKICKSYDDHERGLFYICLKSSIPIAEYLFSKTAWNDFALALISSIETGDINMVKYILNKGIKLENRHLQHAPTEEMKKFILRRIDYDNKRYKPFRFHPWDFARYD